MKRMITLSMLLVALCAITLPALAQGEEAKPFQLALVNPVQIFNQEQSITGLRINGLYGRNVDVKGLDFGFVINHATGNEVGISLAPIGVVGGNMTGLQLGWVNLTKGEMTGIQYGIYSSAGMAKGIQLGWVNNAGQMKGVQLGLINIIHKGGLLPFFPIINAGF